MKALSPNHWPAREFLKIIKCIKLNENKNTTYQNLWNAAKAVLKGKLTAVSKNDLSVHLKKPGKEHKRGMRVFSGVMEIFYVSRGMWATPGYPLSTLYS